MKDRTCQGPPSSYSTAEATQGKMQLHSPCIAVTTAPRHGLGAAEGAECCPFARATSGGAATGKDAEVAAKVTCQKAFPKGTKHRDSCSTATPCAEGQQTVTAGGCQAHWAQSLSCLYHPPQHTASQSHLCQLQSPWHCFPGRRSAGTAVFHLLPSIGRLSPTPVPSHQHPRTILYPLSAAPHSAPRAPPAQGCLQVVAARTGPCVLWV